MSIPYRTQQGLKRILILLLAVAVVALVVGICWFIWLGRFVVYTRDGVKLDFDREENAAFVEALPPAEGATIPIYYNEGEDAVVVTSELTRLTGYYIDTSALKGDMEKIKEQLKLLPAGTPVLVEVKNSYGSFYYNTAVGESITDTLDSVAMDELLVYMNKLDLYTIARLPALRDYYFGLHNTRNGLPTSGGYLWADEDYRYWLNPGRDGTLSYLAAIANELESWGFDEVLFCDFHFPDTERIVFNGDRLETLKEAAQTLVDTCASDTFAVSFETSEGFVPPEGRSRVYVVDADPNEAELLAQSAGVEDTVVRLVFVTALYDTRFDDYGVLRPLETAIAVPEE